MTRAAANSRLAELRREVERERPSARSRPPRKPAPRKRAGITWRTLALDAAKVVIVVTLPFIVYVRASVWLYLSVGLAPWLAVAGGATLTLAIAAGYAAWLSRRFSGRARAGTIARWVALPLAVAYCVYSAVYLSRVNAKSDDVRSYYSSVHPVLRVALGTAILADGDMVVTDMARVAEDYARMRLPVNERTKHYRQPNGWVHAADLRTLGHGEIRNRALQFYFWSMGFQTLRHVGTADHLHVQLPVR
jgi:hypothetical protein